MLFATFAIVFAVFASWGGAERFGFGWFSLTAALVAIAYAWGNPSLFGRRGDGTIPLWRRVALFPYTMFVHGVWHVQRLLLREPPWHQIARGIYLGRWPREKDCPPEVTLVVDLTAELPKAAMGSFAYLLTPTLDGCSPDVEALERLAQRVATHDGVSYVHCAAGHGRSATVVAAALAIRGTHGTLDEVIEHLRSVRPGVRINSVQRAVLDRWAKSRPVR